MAARVPASERPKDRSPRPWLVTARRRAASRESSTGMVTTLPRVQVLPCEIREIGERAVDAEAVVDEFEQGVEALDARRQGVAAQGVHRCH